MSVVVIGSYVQANCLTVQALPVAGASVQASSFWQEHGGKGLNLAIGMHRLGLNTKLLLAIGQDQAGESLLKWLEQEGLSTQYIHQLAMGSGIGFGLIGDDGQNLIVVHPGANYHLRSEHLHVMLDEIKQSHLVCAQFEVQPAIILEAFRLAKNYKVTTLLNPSPWQTIDPELQVLTDILIVNESEALLLFELEQTCLSIQEWCALCIQNYWQGLVLVITLAEHGVIYYARDKSPLHIPAWSIKQADPTGAGDAFTAGLAYALQQAWPVQECLCFANACGALVASQIGVLNVLPSLEAVNNFIQLNHAQHLI